MTTTTRIAALVLVLALLGAAAARDLHIRVRTPVLGAAITRVTAPLAWTGDALYDAQEGVHEAITETTGVEVDHFYVWVHVGSLSVPVDPINFNK